VYYTLLKNKAYCITPSRARSYPQKNSLETVGFVFQQIESRLIMKLEPFSFRPIGIAHSPYKEKVGTPIQAIFDGQTEGSIEVFEPYQEGLEGLEGFSHIYVLYVFDRATEAKLKVTPFLRDVKVGVFATRAPSRPNPIGLSILELKGRKGRFLHVLGLDILDKTPVLDIKPYVPKFDVREVTRKGWMEGVMEDTLRHRADARFGE
jgi:tRNA-Thr(GGU) m(6)t(6)A37 methyltransferase TsaA